jgi:hypothetical protein
MAVREPGLFLRLYSNVFRTIRTNSGETETVMVATSVALCLLCDDQSVVYDHWQQTVFENAHIWHGALVVVSFSIPQLSGYIGITNLKE